MFGFTSAKGLIDGFNSSFNTNTPYAPGTLVVFLNGQESKDHSAETGGSGFTLSEPPPIGSVVTVYYEAA